MKWFIVVNRIENINLKIYKLEFWVRVIFIRYYWVTRKSYIVVWDNNNNSNDNKWL